ncbi:hypothetical protein Tco_0042557, partial [Tanacetum coccineum]
TDNNNAGFVVAPIFSAMLPFFQDDLGFSITMRVSLHFVSNGLPQPWQTLVKIFADYAELLWEVLYYSYLHPTGLIPYPRFTKIIVDHHMTAHPDIPRRLHEKYHKVENVVVVKSIFNSGKNKEGEGMKIP